MILLQLQRTIFKRFYLSQNTFQNQIYLLTMENARKQPYNMKIKEISNSPRRRLPTPPTRAPPPPLPSVAREQLNHTILGANDKYNEYKSQ